jgi:hypothetical protein
MSVGGQQGRDKSFKLSLQRRITGMEEKEDNLLKKEAPFTVNIRRQRD